MASGEPAAGSGSRRQAGTGGLGAGEGGAPAGPPEAVAGGAPAAEQAAAPPASQQRHALHTHQHARLVSKLAPAAAAADGEDAPGRIREDEVEEDEEENDDGGEDDDPEQPLPRDARILSLLLASMGVTEADRMVVPQLLEFAHRYTIDLLRDAQIYSEHAGKSEMDLDDVRLAIQGRLNHAFTSPPEKELIMDLAKEKNQIPLPLIPEKYGIRLPPERHCLTAVNFTILPVKPPQPGIPPSLTMESPARSATPPPTSPAQPSMNAARRPLPGPPPPPPEPPEPSGDEEDEDEEMEEVPVTPSKDSETAANAAAAVEVLARKRLLDEDDDYDD